MRQKNWTTIKCKVCGKRTNTPDRHAHKKLCGQCRGERESRKNRSEV